MRSSCLFLLTLLIAPGFAAAQSVTNGISSPSANTLGLYTNSTEQVFISSTGLVGIGTTAPQQLLHLYGGNLMLGYNGGSTGLMLQGVGGGNNLTLWNDSSNIIHLVNANPTLYLGQSGSTNLAINSSGNVGIGTTAPSYTLEVNGSTKIDSTGGNVPHNCGWKTEYGWACSLPSPSGATNGEFQVWASCDGPSRVVMTQNVGYTATGGLGSSQSWTDGNGYAGWTVTFTNTSDGNCRELQLYCCDM